MYEIEHQVKYTDMRRTPLWVWDVRAKAWKQQGIPDEGEGGGSGGGAAGAAEVEVDDVEVEEVEVEEVEVDMEED